MTSPQIKILLSLASLSIVYAFVCEIRLSRKSRHLAKWVQNEYPELWAGLNFVARNWQGGYPGLKVLYRRNAIGLPGFDQKYKLLQGVEHQMLWGMGVGVVCMTLLFPGLTFWGWHW